MAMMTRKHLDATVTATGGAAQTFFVPVLGGLLHAIVYNKATSSGFSTAGHLTITGAQSGISMLNVSTTGTSGVPVAYYPRAFAQDTSNVNLGNTSAATPPPLPEYIPVANEAIKIVASSGGTASNGGVRFSLDFYLQGQ